MVLVAIAMVAIIAMAALSIDVVTLYLAREEAQRLNALPMLLPSGPRECSPPVLAAHRAAP